MALKLLLYGVLQPLLKQLCGEVANGFMSKRTHKSSCTSSSIGRNDL